jgi:two-component system phosphate regulon sensor histidine kinase PhoR
MATALVIIGLIALTIILARKFYSDRLRRKDQTIRELSVRLTQAQQKSFDDKNELNAILSSMVEGVVVVATDDKILYVSPNASDMFQMRSKEVTLKPYWEVIPHQQINSSIKEALAFQRAVNKEITLMGVQDVFFSMQISPVVQNSRVTSVVAVFHDITELKKLLRMRSEFVAKVSNE